jgi:hypothetical protein
MPSRCHGSVCAARAARVCANLRSVFTNGRRAMMPTRRGPSRVRRDWWRVRHRSTLFPTGDVEESPAWRYGALLIEALIEAA